MVIIMKQKRIVFLLAAVLVLLLVGASFLYQNLKEDNDGESDGRCSGNSGIRQWIYCTGGVYVSGLLRYRHERGYDLQHICYPATYFIDAEGHIVAQANGTLDAETLQRGIDMLCAAE